MASQDILAIVSSIAQGLNVVKINLLDLEGIAVWSTDPTTMGTRDLQVELLAHTEGKARISSFLRGQELVDLAGQPRSIDVVKTGLAFRNDSGQAIGTIQIYRDVSSDVAIQVDDAKKAVLWTTLATMGGLFLVLLGFVVTADVAIYRSNRRELAVVEEANAGLEDRVRQRTRELTEAQDQLVRKEKLAAIGQLAGGIAHDLRNPLGAIKNALYYLKRRMATSEAARANPRIGQFLEIMDDEVQHASQIISDLMSFARVRKPSLSPTNVVEVLDGSLSSLAMNDGVQVVRDLEPELPVVMADRDQLYRVFLNLAGNAQEAMSEGGRLTVGARHADGHLEISFADTGAGMGEELLAKIFEPLFTTKAKGTGLGLAVCQKVVQAHGGSIRVQSAPGRGSTFTVVLPLDADVPPESHIARQGRIHENRVYEEGEGDNPV